MTTRIILQCVCCETPLNNTLDTYGDIGNEMCVDCWYKWQEEQADYSWYGMAPHFHDMTITGDFIGSTVHLPLPEPAADGRYWIEPMRAWFAPDDEVGGAMGMWSRK